MSALSAVMRELIAAGLSGEALVSAVERVEAQLHPVRERSTSASRMARKRARDAITSDACDVTTVTTVTSDARSPSLPSSPQTPQQPTHPPVEITTREGASAKAADFETWWAAYPAKIGKKAARRAWDAARDKPDLPALLAALDRYRASKPPDRDWCHPTTWLSQGRWDDDAPAPNITPLRPRYDRPDHQNSPRDDRLGRMLAGAVAAADGPERFVVRSG